MSNLFKETSAFKKTLIGWELENCKYIESTKNSHEAKIYLESVLEDIKKKEETITKQRKFFKISRW